MAKTNVVAHSNSLKLEVVMDGVLRLTQRYEDGAMHLVYFWPEDFASVARQFLEWWEEIDDSK
jgi:hypothetical protein